MCIIPGSKWSKVVQSCPTLCDSMDCSLPGSSYEIFQARVLEWVAISFSRGSSPPGDWTQVSHIVGRHFTVWVTGSLSFFLDQGSNWCPLHCKADFLTTDPPGKPRNIILSLLHLRNACNVQVEIFNRKLVTWLELRHMGGKGHIDDSWIPNCAHEQVRRVLRNCA